MTEAPQDPLELLKKLTESYRGIKFGTGVVGKTTYATVALIGLWAFVLYRLSETNHWLNVALLIVGLTVTGIYVWWVQGTQRFAKENPGLAMLEGAEFIEYQKWEAEVKGLPPLSGRRIIDPHALPPPQGPGAR